MRLIKIFLISLFLVYFMPHHACANHFGDESDAAYNGSRTESFDNDLDWTIWYNFNNDGTANYHYKNFRYDIDNDRKFWVRDNIIETNLHQFKIDNVMYGIDLILDYDDKTGIVSFYRSEWTGYTHSSYGNVYIADYNYYWKEVRGEDVTPIYGSFDRQAGIISIPLVYYVSAGYFGQDFEYIYINGLPQTDYSCKIEYGGKFLSSNDEPFVCAKVTLGKDVTFARVALIRGELDVDTFNTILDGTYSSMQEITASGEVKFHSDKMEDGFYTFVVVSYIDENEKVDYAQSLFYYQGFQVDTNNMLFCYSKSTTEAMRISLDDLDKMTFKDESILLWKRTGKTEIPFGDFLLFSFKEVEHPYVSLVDSPILPQDLNVRFVVNQGALHIESEIPLKSVFVYDLQGRIVTSDLTEKTDYHFSLATSQTGIYLVKVVRDGKTFVKKIVL